MPDFTARQKADCAAREVRQRERVYPRLVSNEKMTAKFADEQIAIMRAIAEEYAAKADVEDSAGRLL